MSDKWVGYTVSVDCGESLGKFQGQIISVDPTTQALTLHKVFKDGLPYNMPQVMLRSTDIQNLSIIDTATTASSSLGLANAIAVTKPIAKRPGRSVSENLAMNKMNQRDSPRKQTDDLCNRTNTVVEGNRTPNKKDRLRQKLTGKDEACFGTPIDDKILDHEFDFEKNLALFDKQAVYDEINASQHPDVVRQVDAGRRPTKYRHDENVIASAPPMFRRVQVPDADTKEYVTDDALVIPSITPQLRNQLLVVAERLGLTWERQAELVGRAATEMALQLVGGGHRLNPYNMHQWPTVVVMCGPHRQGAMGVNCARQLASHGVHTTVFLLEPSQMGPPLLQELVLFRHTNHRLVTDTQDLPAVADLIVMALAGDAGRPLEPWYHQAARWANESRAPVLALDPPPTGTPAVDTKFSLVPLLPLAHGPDNGKLYLCNVACPQQAFKELGIKYVSPFGPKFVIPLHPNDTTPS